MDLWNEMDRCDRAVHAMAFASLRFDRVGAAQHFDRLLLRLDHARNAAPPRPSL